EGGGNRTAEIDRRESDGMQHPVGHIGRPGDLEEMAAGMAGRLVFHRRLFLGTLRRDRSVWPGNGHATSRGATLSAVSRIAETTGPLRRPVLLGRATKMPGVRSGHTCRKLRLPDRITASEDFRDAHSQWDFPDRARPG